MQHWSDESQRLRMLAIEVAVEATPARLDMTEVGVFDAMGGYLVRFGDGTETVVEITVPHSEVDERLRKERIRVQSMTQSRPLTEDHPTGKGSWVRLYEAPAGGVLRFAVRLLPQGEQADWLEEQRSYLADLPTRRSRWAWIVAQFLAMPQYAYAVRTGRDKEPA